MPSCLPVTSRGPRSQIACDLPAAPPDVVAAIVAKYTQPDDLSSLPSQDLD